MKLFIYLWFKFNYMAYSDDEKQKIIQSICDNVVENKVSFNKAVDESEITLTSFYTWIANNKDFEKLYNYARIVRSDILFEEIIDISDETEEGVVIKETPNGTVIERGDMIRHRQLKIDARKWVVSKMQPKKYGDKLDLTTDGEKINQPNPIAILPDGTKIEI